MKATRVFRDKRGLTPNVWVSVALGIAFGVIMIAVVAIVLAALKTGTYSVPGNTSTNTTATTIVSNGQSFLVNLTGQLGTVGTVAGVLLLVGLLVASGIGGYMLYQRSQR